MEIKDMTFEQALQELERTVGRLESEALTLEESLALYRRGVLLFEHCRDHLQQAEGWVKQVVATPSGYELRPLVSREDWESRGAEPGEDDDDNEESENEKE
jgi:exodeoxyribonuclease VII small subunit